MKRREKGEEKEVGDQLSGITSKKFLDHLFMCNKWFHICRGLRGPKAD